MKFIHWWSVISAIATLSCGSMLPVLAASTWQASNGSNSNAETHVQQDVNVQADLADPTDNLPAEPVLITSDAVLRVAPDPRATITHQITAGTPVRVTHQSDRYFYIEVIEIENLEANRDVDLAQGWISDCQLYGQCQ